ncbi:cytochrome P450 3A8-like [Oppia nitens]|uniref:cytochrome P450 3A8-like n=1 Tax=Oppia nitens TaxID=1686743 RepID=UPI0023DA209D|nr:cytochrome P450 3A8-like [Oppia nitens]
MLQLAFYMLCLFIACYIYLAKIQYNYWSKRGIPGPKPLVYFGNLLPELFKSKSLVELERFQKYGKIYGTFNGSQPVLTIADPELLKQILVKDFDQFRNRSPNPFLTPVGHRVCRQSLDNSRDGQWVRVRPVLSSLFSAIKLRSMKLRIDRQINRLTDRIDGLIGDNSSGSSGGNSGSSSGSGSSDGQPTVLDITKLYDDYGLSCMMSCMFSMDTIDDNTGAYQLLNDLLSPRRWRILLFLLMPGSLIRLLFNLTHPIPTSQLDAFVQLTRDQLRQRLSCISSTGSLSSSSTSTGSSSSSTSSPQYGDDLLGYLMQSNKILFTNNNNKNNDDNNNNNHIETDTKYITDDEVAANLFAMFEAGSGTNSSIISFLTYNLATNPPIQDRLYNELITQCMDTTISSSVEQLDCDRLLRNDFMDAVVAESLRMNTTTLREGRVAANDYQLTDDIVIYRGQVVEFAKHAVHYCRDYYPDPHRFKPDRWLPDSRQQQSIPPYGYIPFGAGARMCVGKRFALMSVKLTIARLLLKYRLAICDDINSNSNLNANNLITKLKFSKIFEHYTHTPESFYLSDNRQQQSIPSRTGTYRFGAGATYVCRCKRFDLMSDKLTIIADYC